jgi:16S rRNA processing protein RimM
MINIDDLRIIGRLVKPHGINGEIAALLTDDVDVCSLSCIMLKLDGIFVPFFPDSIRRKGSDSILMQLDGVATEEEATRLCPNDVYALVGDLPQLDADSEGFYAADLIGFSVKADGAVLGRIIDINDSTSNCLFVIERASDSSELLIPIAEEYIQAVDVESRSIVLDLPVGLLDI